MALGKKILLAAGIVIGVFTLTAAVGLIVFFAQRQQIHDRILSEFNQTQEGELYFHRVSIAPFEFLPYFALSLDSVLYFENKKELRGTDEEPIIRIRTLTTGVEYGDVFKGVFKPAGLVLEHGQINLVTHPDSSFNVLNAIGIHRSDSGPEDKERPKAVFGVEKEGPLGEVDIVEFIDILVVNQNRINHEEISIFLEEVTSHVTEQGKMAYVHNYGDITLNHYRTGGTYLLREKHLELDLKYDFDMETLNGVFTSSQIDLNTAKFQIGGTFNLNLPVEYDLTFDARKTGLGVINLDDPETYLQDEGTGNGSISLKGSIKGSSSDRIPIAHLEFQASNVDLDDPQTDSYVKGISVDGYFSTGDQPDLSQAELRIRDFRANVSGDSLTADLSIRNFKDPEVTMSVDSRIKLKGLDEDLGLEFLSNLNGVLSVHADVAGTIDLEGQNIAKDIGQLDIRLENVSFAIPEAGQTIDRLNAIFHIEPEQLSIKQLDIKSGKNDLSLTGYLTNFLGAISGEKTAMKGQIQLGSQFLDASEVFASNPKLAEGSYLDEQMRDLKAVISFESNTKYFYETEDNLPAGKIVIESLSARLQNRPDISSLQGTFYVASTHDASSLTETNFEEYYGVEGLKFKWGSSDLEVNGKLNHLVDPKNRPGSPLIGDLTISSSKLDFSELLSFDPVLAQAYDETITKLRTQIHMETTLEKILVQRGIPMGHIELKGLSANFKNRANLYKMSGQLYVDKDSLGILDFEGQMGKSRVKFSQKIMNYQGFWRSDTLVAIRADFDYQSSLLRTDDLFQYKDRFYLPEKMRGDLMSDFVFNGNLEISNLDFLGVSPLPDLKLTVDRITWKNKEGLHYKDLNIVLERNDEDLNLVRFAGEVGQSDFVVSAFWRNFRPFIDPDLSDFSASFSVEADRLNLNELLSIQLPKRDQPRRKIKPLDYLYDDLELSLNVKDLIFKDFRVTELSGQMTTERSQKIHLNNFKFQTAGGSITMQTDLDTSDPYEINLVGNIQIDRVNLEQVFLPLKYEQEQMDISKYFKGKFSSKIQSNFYMDQDLTIDVGRSYGKIEFELDEGAIDNYPPVLELSKYLGDRDLTHVKFAEIKNTVELKDGVLTVPRMDLSSTLGQLYLQGTYDMDGNIEYLVEVPLRLVRRAAWTSLTKRAREEGAPEDEIQQASKKPYVSVRVYGNDQEEIHVKLGRGKEGRKKKRQEKKEARKSG